MSFVPQKNKKSHGTEKSVRGANDHADTFTRFHPSFNSIYIICKPFYSAGWYLMKSCGNISAAVSLCALDGSQAYPLQIIISNSVGFVKFFLKDYLSNSVFWGL